MLLESYACSEVDRYQDSVCEINAMLFMYKRVVLLFERISNT